MDAVLLTLVALGVLGGIVNAVVRGRRSRRRRQEEADAFADAMRAAGFTRDDFDRDVWRLARAGQRLEVDAHPPTFATVNWMHADGSVDDVRITQEFSDEEGDRGPRLPVFDESTRMATQHVAPMVPGLLDGGADGLFQVVQVGPGIVSVGVSADDHRGLVAAIQRAAARSEGLLRLVDASYADHDHLPIMSRSEAQQAFAEALTIPGADRDDAGPAGWTVPLRGADLDIAFPGRLDLAELEWTIPDSDERPSEFYGVAALTRRPDGRLVAEDVSRLDPDLDDRGSATLAAILARWAPRLAECWVLDVLVLDETVELSVWGAGPAAVARNVEAVVVLLGGLCDELLATLGTDAAPPASTRPPAPTPELRGPFL